MYGMIWLGMSGVSIWAHCGTLCNNYKLVLTPTENIAIKYQKYRYSSGIIQIGVDNMKVKTTAIVADLSGKLNGTVFFRTRYGLIGRTKVTPPNPQTPFQTDSRSILSTLSKAWSSLTQAQRDAWEYFAKRNPVTDQFGDSKVLSGIAMYIKVNAVIMNADQTQIDDAPNNYNCANFAFAMDNDSLANNEITVGPIADPIPANHCLQIWMTPVISAGVSFVGNLYKLIASSDVALIGGEFTAGFSGRIGLLQSGDIVSVKALAVNVSNGATIVLDEQKLTYTP